MSEPYHAISSIAPVEKPVEKAIAPTPVPEPDQAEEAPEAVNRTLEELAKEGARRMLERALAVEVDEFLGRHRYERKLLAEQGYRNGYGRPRPVAVGTWPIEVKAPRIRDLPPDTPPFYSAILPRRRMLSPRRSACLLGCISKA